MCLQYVDTMFPGFPQRIDGRRTAPSQLGQWLSWPLCIHLFSSASSSRFCRRFITLDPRRHFDVAQKASNPCRILKLQQCGCYQYQLYLSMLSWLRFQDISNSAWASAKLLIRDTRLWTALSAAAREGIAQFAAQKISNTAWGFSTIEVRQDKEQVNT